MFNSAEVPAKYNENILTGPANINDGIVKSDSFNENVGSAQKFLHVKFRTRPLTKTNPGLINKSLRSTSRNTSRSNQKGSIISVEEHRKFLDQFDKLCNESLKETISSGTGASSIQQKQTVTEEKRYSINMFDHSFLENIILTKATIKYGLILVNTVLLVAFLVFISVVGAVHLGTCPLSPNVPIYLMVMGFMGTLRLLLFYSCPYNYSNSIAAKIYENVIESLIVDRYKVSKDASKAYATSKTDDETSCRSQCIRFFSFIFNFCCCCCCFSCLFFKQSGHCCCYECTKSTEDQIKTTSPKPVLFQLDEDSTFQSECQITSIYLSTGESTNFTGSMEISSKSKSFSSSMSERTTSSNMSTLFSDFFCFNSCFRTARMNQSNKSFQDSRLSLDKHLKGTNRSQKRLNIPKTKYTFSKRHSRRDRRVTRNGTSYHFTSRKHIKRQYRKQQPYRLIDPNAIRYAIIHFIQRCIDIFIIVWFIFGNYWVLAVFDEQSANFFREKPINSFTTNKSNTSTVALNNRNLLGMLQNRTVYKELVKGYFIVPQNNNASVPLECNMFCYQTAFVQIISSYSLFLVFVIFVLTYRIHMITCRKENGQSQRPKLRRRRPNAY